MVTCCFLYLFGPKLSGRLGSGPQPAEIVVADVDVYDEKEIEMPLCSSPNQTTINLPSYFRQFETDNWSQYYLYLPTASVRASARLNIDQWYQGSTARSGRYHGGCAYTGYSNKHEGGRKHTCLEKQACTFISLKASSYIQRSKFVSMYNHN